MGDWVTGCRVVVVVLGVGVGVWVCKIGLKEFRPPSLVKDARKLSSIYRRSERYMNRGTALRR